jgi:hypothetical protein
MEVLTSDSVGRKKRALKMAAYANGTARHSIRALDDL